jgi:hypothetical protein
LLLLNPSLAAVFSTETTLAEQTNVTSSPLGDLIGFTNQVDPSQGTVFAGTGFNTIFRPQSPKTPTKLPVPVPGSDNILELNLTAETLSFAAPLGNVPNRGFGDQGDITFNAVPYCSVHQRHYHATEVGGGGVCGMDAGQAPQECPVCGVSEGSSEPNLAFQRRDSLPVIAFDIVL